MILLDLLIIVLGLLFGSFFAAYSYRLPRGLSVAKGRSFCPHCKKQIEWYDNFPVFSFLFLGGKCRHCKKPISIRYPVIELSTSIGFFAIWKMGGSPIHIIYSLLIFSTLVLIFIVDLEHQIIPDEFVFAGIAITFLKILVLDNPGIYQGLFAGFLGATILLLIHLATRGRGMGLGDVKFAVLGGMFIGLSFLPIWLFLGFLTGAIAGIILILGRRAGLKDAIAFGPFLVIGLAIAYVWGPAIFKYLFP